MRWAASEEEIRAVLLVGSRARGDAAPGADIDIVLLTTGPARYVERDDWHLGLHARIVRTRRRGALTERRLLTDEGDDVDLAIGGLSWASVAPLDPGTRRVVAAGARVLHDPDGILQTLLEACG